MLFHRIDRPSRLLKDAFDIDLLKGIDDVQFANTMLLRRHVFEHRGGVADARYIEESGDKSVAEGSLIRESADNVHRIADVLLRMARNLETGFNEIFDIKQ